MILKNKSKLPPGTYVKEDYFKEVLEKRKQLAVQVEDERKKGNIVFLKYDRIIVKKLSETNRNKRKREDPDSPQSSAQKKIDLKSNPATISTKGKEILKPNIFNYIERGRSASLLPVGHRGERRPQPSSKQDT